MRRVPRRGLQRLDDHLVNVPVSDRPRTTRTRLIEQPVQPIAREPVAPFTDRRVIKREPLSVSVFFKPSAPASTIRERCASACALLPRRAHDSSCSRSGSLRTTSTAIGLGIHQV